MDGGSDTIALLELSSEGEATTVLQRRTAPPAPAHAEVPVLVRVIKGVSAEKGGTAFFLTVTAWP